MDESESTVGGVRLKTRRTYQVVVADARIGIKCLLCGLTSWHPMDLQELFCGKCSRYHDGPRYTHGDAAGMFWRYEGARPVSALADAVMQGGVSEAVSSDHGKS